jgi:hypothetical protein
MDRPEDFTMALERIREISACKTPDDFKELLKSSEQTPQFNLKQSRDWLSSPKPDMSKKIQIPSQHQVGDDVLFSIRQSPDTAVTLKATVIAVHFYKGNKVKYDLEIPVEDGAPTRIYNIDSCFVTGISH